MGLRFLDMPRSLLPAAILTYLLFVCVALTALPARAQPTTPSNIPGCPYLASPGTLSDKQTAPCTMTGFVIPNTNAFGASPLYLIS